MLEQCIKQENGLLFSFEECKINDQTWYSSGLCSFLERFSLLAAAASATVVVNVVVVVIVYFLGTSINYIEHNFDRFGSVLGSSLRNIGRRILMENFDATFRYEYFGGFSTNKIGIKLLSIFIWMFFHLYYMSISWGKPKQSTTKT